VTTTERRRVVERVQAAASVSQRRAVRFTGFPRSPQEALRARIRALAAERLRWGYRWIHRLLVREGWSVNRKRVQRLYREGGVGRPPAPEAAAQWHPAASASTTLGAQSTVESRFRARCLEPGAALSLPDGAR
jgi:hypothetical protein